MRVAWLTDIHLDFLTSQAQSDFCRSVRAQEPDLIFLTGDISVSTELRSHLSQLVHQVEKPTYFVLGNHDFYYGSIAKVRQAIARFCDQRPLLTYLSHAGITFLTPKFALLGHDGWGDARYGCFERSYVQLNDHTHIQDFAHLTPAKLKAALQRLGDEAAGFLDQQLSIAFGQVKDVILLTHVPPFPESCLYQNQRSDEHWLPFFACQAIGDVLRKQMTQHPHCRLTVYCGHTHHASDVQILSNLRVVTGGAEYGKPQIAGIIMLDEHGSSFAPPV